MGATAANWNGSAIAYYNVLLPVEMEDGSKTVSLVLCHSVPVFVQVALGNESCRLE